MTSKLNLKGLEREIYAIIFGFSRDGSGTFNGSIKYIAELTNSTERGVQKALKTLIDNGNVIKKPVTAKLSEYIAIVPELTTPTNLVHVESELSSSDSEQSSHNNKDNKTIKKENIKKESLYSKCSTIIYEKFSSPTVIDAMHKYLSVRIKTCLTEQQWRAIAEELFTIADTEEQALAIIDKAYKSGYRKLYPIKEYGKSNAYKDNIVIEEKTDEALLRDKYREEFSMVPLKDRPSYEEWRKENA